MGKIIKILIVSIIFLCMVFSLFYFNKKEHTVVFIGDSITDYGDDYDNGFVKQFMKKYSSKVKIYGEGICGNETTDILERLDSDVIAHKPDVMFIMIGINDINNESRPLEEILQNTAKITDIVKENNIEPIIMNVSLITENLFSDKNRQVDEYNEMLKNMSQEKQVQFIDINTPLKAEVNKNNSVMEDDLHLNDTGNDVLANEVIKAFENTYAKKWRLNK